MTVSMSGMPAYPANRNRVWMRAWFSEVRLTRVVTEEYVRRGTIADVSLGDGSSNDPVCDSQPAASGKSSDPGATPCGYKTCTNFENGRDVG